MGTGELQEFAKAYTAAWCSQDAASVASYFSPGGSLRVNEAPPAVGRSAITVVAQGFMSAFPDLQVLLDEAAVTGEGAVYRWTLVGTHGESGRKVRISGFEEWTFGADGRIGESLGHFDAADYERQISN